MNKKKIIINYIKIFIILILSVVLFFLFIFWFAIGGGILLMPDPPEPLIKYSEFPFVLEYEKNGEHFKIEDTVICEYNGIGANEGRGKYLKWKSYLKKHNNDEIILYEKDNTKIVFAPCNSDNAAIYMGGETFYGNGSVNDLTYPFPGAWYICDEGDHELIIEINEKKLFEEYGIKLTYIETSEPITNEFK
ncbi:MAG: hypothetical protein IJ583_08280 [Firmicutes bacterium]|nr:hypothetical protein [Bacillota bacterium]